jgi:hypothetical protein
MVKPTAKKQIVEDEYLDTDSEEDEFAEQPVAGPSGSSDEEEGITTWEPDSWEGEGGNDESEDEEVSSDQAGLTSETTRWQVIIWQN